MPDPHLTIDWCDLTGSYYPFITNAFVQLAAHLQRKYPELPSIVFRRLPDEALEELPDYLLSRLPGSGDTNEISGPLQHRRVFVFCSGDEDFAQAYQEENELAHWGVAIPCKVAIAWEPNKHLVWHESLHLLNAKDCYNKYGIDKCPRQNCVMRRMPTGDNSHEALVLCAKNEKRISRCLTDSLFLDVDDKI